MAAVIPGIVVAPEQGFEGLVGLVVEDFDEQHARGSVAVRRELMQPWAIVHGGVFAMIAESLASWATATSVAPEGQGALGARQQHMFLRPVSGGRSTVWRRAATAGARHGSGTST